MIQQIENIFQRPHSDADEKASRRASLSRSQSSYSLRELSRSGPITTGPSDRLRETLNVNMFSCQARKTAGASLLQSIRRQVESERPYDEDGDGDRDRESRPPKRSLSGDGLGRFSWHERTNRWRNPGRSEAPRNSSPRQHGELPKAHEQADRSKPGEKTAHFPRSSSSSNARGILKRGLSNPSLLSTDAVSPQRPMLWRGLMGRSSRQHVEKHLDKLNIHSIRVEEPLLKYGKQMGTIRCTIDVWWQADDPNCDDQTSNFNSTEAKDGASTNNRSSSLPNVFDDSADQSTENLDVPKRRGLLRGRKPQKSVKRLFRSRRRLKPTQHEETPWPVV